MIRVWARTRDPESLLGSRQIVSLALSNHFSSPMKAAQTMASLTQEMGTPTPNWDTFELFPEVPTELRRKIWHATVDWKARILPRRPISELEVCRESREFLLEIYQPCFLSLSERKEEKYWDALYIEALAKTLSFRYHFTPISRPTYSSLTVAL